MYKFVHPQAGQGFLNGDIRRSPFSGKGDLKDAGGSTKGLDLPKSRTLQGPVKIESEKIEIPPLEETEKEERKDSREPCGSGVEICDDHPAHLFQRGKRPQKDARTMGLWKFVEGKGDEDSIEKVWKDPWLGHILLEKDERARSPVSSSGHRYHLRGNVHPDHPTFTPDSLRNPVGRPSRPGAEVQDGFSWLWGKDPDGSS